MRSLLPKAGWMLAGVLGLFVVAGLAGVVSGGPLDPAGAPGATMLRISELPPSWHQILPSSNGAAGGCNSARFQCVMGDVAVLDQETGLVWQRTVGAETGNSDSALLACEFSAIGGRYGWRVPTHPELLTITDTSADHLPDGHPFVGVLTANDDMFWTSTKFTSLDLHYFFVVNIDVPGDPLTLAGTSLQRHWCVRGGGQGWDVRS